jgi:hypothetical protein
LHPLPVPVPVLLLPVLLLVLLLLVLARLANQILVLRPPHLRTRLPRHPATPAWAGIEGAARKSPTASEERTCAHPHSTQSCARRWT